MEVKNGLLTSNRCIGRSLNALAGQLKYVCLYICLSEDVPKTIVLRKHNAFDLISVWVDIAVTGIP